MNYLYLLDTNILSDLIRHPSGAVARHIAEVGEGRICTSIVVACELRFGAAKSGSARLGAQLSRILDVLDVLPLMSPVEVHYAQLRAHLERIGTPIGPNDMLIAAHALAHSLTVVTANVQEFSRIPGLAVEYWLLT
jgi:tRNA(fMet)-specific endonuclease VapC